MPEQSKKGFTQRDLFYPVSAVTHEFLDWKGEQLYFVCYKPKDAGAIATVIIAEPFGNERTCAYLTMVRWARFLASSGFQVVRFDYRGCGESTGTFSDQTFQGWEEDLEFVVRTCLTRFFGQPLILFGLRLGAILSSRVFARGLGQTLLMWNCIDSCEIMLREILRRKIASDVLQKIAPKGISRESYIQELIIGRSIFVEGLSWTKSLWQSGSTCASVLPGPSDVRPWFDLRFGAPFQIAPAASPHFKTINSQAPAFWIPSPLLNPNLDELFMQSRHWLLAAEKVR